MWDLANRQNVYEENRNGHIANGAVTERTADDEPPAPEVEDYSEFETNFQILDSDSRVCLQELESADFDAVRKVENLEENPSGPPVRIAPEQAISARNSFESPSSPLRHLSAVNELQGELNRRLNEVELIRNQTSAAGFEEGFARGCAQGRSEAVGIFLAEQRFTEELLSRIIPRIIQIVETLAKEVVDENLSLTPSALANRVRRFLDSKPNSATGSAPSVIRIRVAADSDKAQLSLLDRTLNELQQYTCEIRLSSQLKSNCVEVETSDGLYLLDPSMHLDQLLHTLRADPCIQDQFYREILINELCAAIQEQ